jgi:hypothetical protein
MTALFYDDTDGETIYEYYDHPKKHIPPVLLDWFEEYSYYKEFQGTAPSFDDCNLRFLEAKNVYESYLEFWKRPNVNNEGYS